MQRSIVLAGLLAILVGCGRDGGFKDKTEELSYLEALSNPTPDQWRRRRELTADRKVAQIEAEMKVERLGPAVGSMATLPDHVLYLSLYDGLESLRARHRINKDGDEDYKSPESKAIELHRITDLTHGSYFTVLEILSDAVKVGPATSERGKQVVPRDNYDGPAKVGEGYVSRWWDSNAHKSAVIVGKK